jgi:hypothetical protein
MILIGFILWIFIVPSLAGSFLILAFVAACVPPLYFALTWFAVASTTALVLCGPFWILPGIRFASESLPSDPHKTNSTQEKNNETPHQGTFFFE